MVAQSTAEPPASNQPLWTAVLVLVAGTVRVSANAPPAAMATTEAEAATLRTSTEATRTTETAGTDLTETAGSTVVQCLATIDLETADSTVMVLAATVANKDGAVPEKMKGDGKVVPATV